MKEKLKSILTNKRNIVILFILIALTASIQSLFLGKKTFCNNGIEYTHYNNYVIFEKSFYHLKNNQDLYIQYPNEYWDSYKYTPTFSIIFRVFSVFPDWIGLNLWNFLNAFILLFAIYNLPRLNNIKKGLVLIFVLVELFTSLQNSQSNALIAGLIVLSFGLLEKKKYFFGALCLVFSVYIKLFGIVGVLLFLFYPKKWKLALYSIIWTILLFIIPLAFVDINQYIKLFQSYWAMLNNDYSISYGYSVMGWLNSWFGIETNKIIIGLAGMVVLLLPMLRFSRYKNYTFRYLALASILIWIVIFNYKAESPTFVIAMTGVSLWFITAEKNIFNLVLFVSAFVLTSLSPTDIFPRFLREDYLIPYNLKVLPCILIWTKIIYDMIVLKKDSINEYYEAQHADN